MKKNNRPQVGIDMAKVTRFENKQTLAKKILAPEEWQKYKAHPLPAQYLASRFAAKEAFIKAYRLPPLPDLNTIEVKETPTGVPYIWFQQNTYELSISHDGDYAIAVVII
jgi:holo-[acyl-carrier protein] synthase